MERIKSLLFELKEQKNRTFKVLIVAGLILFILIPLSYALLRNSTFASGNLVTAIWNVTLEQTGVNNNLTVVPENANATYTLNVKSLSEVDVNYSIVVSNLPSGVDVSIDGVTFPPVSNGTVTFSNAGTILYSSNDRINSHTLTFRGASGATLVNNQAVTINVLAEQTTTS